MPEPHPTTTTPQPFHTRSLQITAMQVTKRGDIHNIAEWMNNNGATTRKIVDGHNWADIIFDDHAPLPRRFILNHGDWITYDGHAFDRMTNDQFTTYHHTTANS